MEVIDGRGRSGRSLRGGIQQLSPEAAAAVAFGKEIEASAIRRPPGVAVQGRSIRNRDPEAHWNRGGTGEGSDENPVAVRAGFRVEDDPAAIGGKVGEIKVPP